MKIRFTLGNIIGLVTAGAGVIAAHEQVINLVANTIGGKAVAVGVTVLAIARGVLSFNHQQTPEHLKMNAGPILFEKTGPLK